MSKRSRLVNPDYKKLESKTVAIVGVGGTGNLVATLLARSGIKKLILIDRDIVDESNLERQLLYDTFDIDKPKTNVAKHKLSTYCDIESHNIDLNPNNIDTIQDCDLVIDCTDNLETRLIINDYCKKNNKTWLYTGAIQNIGTIYLVTPNGPCINCILNDKASEGTCATIGVTNVCVSTVSSLSASIAMSFLALDKVEDKMLRINLTNNEIMKLSVKKKDDCNTCNNNYTYLENTDTKQIRKFCSTGNYSFSPNKHIDLKKLKEKLEKIDEVNYSKNILTFKNITVFDDGRVLIKAESESKAKKIYDEYISN